MSTLFHPHTGLQNLTFLDHRLSVRCTNASVHGAAVTTPIDGQTFSETGSVTVLEDRSLSGAAKKAHFFLVSSLF